MSGKYDDIIDLPHFVSRDRKHMSNHDRAAQFAPFAALTGYGEQIQETARLTDKEIILSEDEKDKLNEKLEILSMHISEKPVITIKYFEPDVRKDGGKYLTETITLRNIDTLNRLLISDKKEKYPLDYILNIDSSLFLIYKIDE